MVAVELCCRPISKSANQNDYRGSFARLEFRHDGIEGTRIPGVRANVKTHLVHPHERGLVRTYMLAHARTHACARASKIPMERPMTGMTCTRCRTEDPSRSSAPLLPVLPPVRRLRSGSLGLPSPREVRA